MAGKRAGLDGERSGLFMEQIRLIKEMRESDRLSKLHRGSDEPIRPRYMVWENVPGAFSSNKGEDFRVVLEEVARIVEEGVSIPRPEKGKWSNAGVIIGDGWSIAWRVFDAQYWGVPQRRKRICLVADFNGHSAAEIVFNEAKQYGCSNGGDSKSSVGDIGAESRSEVQPVCEGLSGNPEQSREEGQEASSYAAGSIGTGHPVFTYQDREGCAGGGKGFLLQEDRSASLRTNNFQTVFQPVVYNGVQVTSPQNVQSQKPGDPCYALTTDGDIAGTLDASYYKGCGMRSGVERTYVVQQDTYAMQAFGDYKYSDKASGVKQRDYKDATDLVVRIDNSKVRYIVRRLTPLECERLQGYPDGWTDIGDYIDSKGKKRKVSDSHKYKALGNSIALPSWRWVLKRMCDNYERPATMASLFDGISGFPWLWTQINGRNSVLWTSEIEDFPSEVCKRHFGNEAKGEIGDYETFL